MASVAHAILRFAVQLGLTTRGAFISPLIERVFATQERTIDAVSRF